VRERRTLTLVLSQAEFGRSEFAIINTDNPEDLPVESDLILADKGGHKLGLRIHYQYASRSPLPSALVHRSLTLAAKENTQTLAGRSESKSTRRTP
jgi:hypothetical protein